MKKLVRETVYESLATVHSKVDPKIINKNNTRFSEFCNYLVGYFLNFMKLDDIIKEISWLEEEIKELYNKGISLLKTAKIIRNEFGKY